MLFRSEVSVVQHCATREEAVAWAQDHQAKAYDRYALVRITEFPVLPGSRIQVHIEALRMAQVRDRETQLRRACHQALLVWYEACTALATKIQKDALLPPEARPIPLPGEDPDPLHKMPTKPRCPKLEILRKDLNGMDEALRAAKEMGLTLSPLSPGG